MAASRVGKWLFNLAKPVNSHVTQQSSLLANQQNQLNHVRTKMVDFRMIRDNKRRKTVQEYGPERFRINMVRKSKIIPREIKEIADKEIREFPLNSAPVRIHNRCILTSRPVPCSKGGTLVELCFAVLQTITTFLELHDHLGDLFQLKHVFVHFTLHEIVF